MRLIFDTNILLSALLSPLGAPAKLLDAWERKTFTLVACEALIAEFRGVATRPFFRSRLRASAAELLAAGLRDFCFFCRELLSLKQHKSAKIVTPAAMIEILNQTETGK